ncbi:Succinate-semialdehyde dehydrogenase [Blattella germanica]|nr:Succinate-semialdehyde dehydrogenase [Blattella germanica]
MFSIRIPYSVCGIGLARIMFRQASSMADVPLVRNKAFVNGAWVSAASGKTFDVKNPANGEVISTVPDMDASDTEKAIQAAAEAFESWQYTTAKERAEHLRKWYNLLMQNQNDLASIVTAEAGKPLKEALGEVSYGNSFIEWFAEEARRSTGEVIASPTNTKEMLLIKQPIGVAGLITPWNFPIAMITRKAGAAIAAGCTCVVKPAEDTPLTALALAQLAEDAGIPKGVFNVITSDRGHAAELSDMILIYGETVLSSERALRMYRERFAMRRQPGSTNVGKLLYKQCASGVKRISLELGGNAPFIVFDSADIDKAVAGAIASKFRNCGQTCVSANRLFIQEGVYDTFIHKLQDRMKAMKMGNGMDPLNELGPLINKQQTEKKGAKVQLGGKPATELGEWFYEPTLLTNVAESMTCYNEEIFGPVAVCIKFKTEEEVLRISNSTKTGLAGYFYSGDISQIFRVAKRLAVGMVGVNEGIISTAEAAFGGIKESGLGREGSHHGMEEFTYTKYICIGNL